MGTAPASRRKGGAGWCRGGRCGGISPAQGRAEGPTAQLQWSVVSGHFVGDGRVEWTPVRHYRGIAKEYLILGYTRSAFVLDMR